MNERNRFGDLSRIEIRWKHTVQSHCTVHATRSKVTLFRIMPQKLNFWILAHKKHTSNYLITTSLYATHKNDQNCLPNIWNINLLRQKIRYSTDRAQTFGSASTFILKKTFDQLSNQSERKLQRFRWLYAVVLFVCRHKINVLRAELYKYEPKVAVCKTTHKKTHTNVAVVWCWTCLPMNSICIKSETISCCTACFNTHRQWDCQYTHTTSGIWSTITIAFK